MRRVFSNVNDINLFFNANPTCKPPLQASASPIPKILIWTKQLLATLMIQIYLHF